MVTPNEVWRALVTISDYCYNQGGCSTSCPFFQSSINSPCSLAMKTPEKWSIPKTLITQAVVLEFEKVEEVVENEFSVENEVKTSD